MRKAMWAYNVNWAITRIIFIPLSIVGAITTLLGGILLALPLVGFAFLLAFQLVWLPMLAVVLGTGWFWHKAPPGIRSLAAVIGVPIAILGNIALSLMPAGGDPEDMFGKRVKQALCQSWPWPAANPQGQTAVELLEAEGKSFAASVFELADYQTRRDLGILAPS